MMLSALVLTLASAAWTPPPDNTDRFGAPAATCAAAFPKDPKRRASCQKVRQFSPHEHQGNVCQDMLAQAKALGFFLDRAKYSVNGHEGHCEFTAEATAR